LRRPSTDDDDDGGRARAARAATMKREARLGEGSEREWATERQTQ
jgi:hypothetical protein